jgi:lipoate synthase
MTVIAIPKILRERLTDEGADVFVEILDKVEDRAQKVTLEIAEERFEKKISQLDGKIETTRAQLETRIAEAEARLIKWMFIFWAGQITILFAFFRK